MYVITITTWTTLGIQHLLIVFTHWSCRLRRSLAVSWLRQLLPRHPVKRRLWQDIDAFPQQPLAVRRGCGFVISSENMTRAVSYRYFSPYLCFVTHYVNVLTIPHGMTEQTLWLRIQFFGHVKVSLSYHVVEFKMLFWRFQSGGFTWCKRHEIFIRCLNLSTIKVLQCIVNNTDWQNTNKSILTAVSSEQFM